MTETAKPTADQLTASFVNVTGQYFIGNASLTDCQASFASLHPSHRGPAQGKALMASMSIGIVTDDTVTSWLGAITNLPTSTTSRTKVTLTDDQFTAVQRAVHDLVIGATDSIKRNSDPLVRAAAVRLVDQATKAIMSATSGSRNASTLRVLAVGDQLTGKVGDKVVSAKVVKLSDKGSPAVTTKGSASPVSLSAAAKRATGHSTNGRAFWRHADGSALTV